MWSQEVGGAYSQGNNASTVDCRQATSSCSGGALWQLGVCFLTVWGVTYDMWVATHPQQQSNGISLEYWSCLELGLRCGLP